MVTVKLSEMFTDIRGRIGTTIYTVWKGIHVARREPKNFQYPWSSQYNWKMRKLVDMCNYTWTTLLSTAQKNGWYQMALTLSTLGGLYAEGAVERIPGLRRYGGPMSGINALTLLNALRWSIGKTDILEDAPNGVAFPPQPVFSSLDFVPGSPIGLKATYQDPGAVAEPTFARAWCRGVALSHLLIAKSLPVATPWELDWNSAHYAKGGVLDLKTDTYQVQLDLISESGLFSPPSEIKLIKIAPAFTAGLWGGNVWNGFAWGPY